MTTGERIRRMRMQRGWSQRELGKRAGISQQAVSAIERGERAGLVDNLEAIAQALNTTAGKLLGDNGRASGIQYPVAWSVQETAQGDWMVKAVAQASGRARMIVDAVHVDRGAIGPHDVLIVDPDEKPRHGDWVVVLDPDTGQRQLVTYELLADGRVLLSRIGDARFAHTMSPSAQVEGVVIEHHRVLRPPRTE